MAEEELRKLKSTTAKTSSHQNGGVSAVRDRDKDDGDRPLLSSHALAALQEFLADQDRSIASITPMMVEAGGEESEKVTLVPEDWRLSQFWYEPETAETVAKEVVVLSARFSGCRVACIACPTLYVFLKKIDPNVSVQLLEYDTRFQIYGSDFTFYDYNEPEDLPSQLKHSFHVIVADPPYLSGECLEKVSQTISCLARPTDSLVLILTGLVQREHAAELLGVRPCVFRPQHSSKLGNEFRVFTSYNPGTRLGGWEEEN